MMIRSQKGFTLIEMMIVTALVGVLAAIAIPQFQMFYLKARRTEAFVVVNAIHKSQMSYYSDRDEFVTNSFFGLFGDMQTLGIVELISQSAYQIQLGGFLPDGSLTNPRQAYSVTLSHNLDADLADFDLVLMKYRHSNYPLASDGIAWLWRDDIHNTINPPM